MIVPASIVGHHLVEKDRIVLEDLKANRAPPYAGLVSSPELERGTLLQGELKNVASLVSSDQAGPPTRPGGSQIGRAPNQSRKNRVSWHVRVRHFGIENLQTASGRARRANYQQRRGGTIGKLIEAVVGPRLACHRDRIANSKLVAGGRRRD